MARTDRYQILEDEPSSRLPVCILIDRSYSMRVVSGGQRTGETVSRDGDTFDIVQGGTNQRMEQLLAGFRSFVKNVHGDVRARSSVEIAIVSFSDTVTIERDFAPVDSSLDLLSIEAFGDGTRLGLAVKTALQLLDRRKEDYNAYSVSHYHPQLVILTDGCATDPDSCAEQGEIVQERMGKDELICLPFLIGDEKNVETLRHFGPEGTTFRIEGVNLVALFQYLSQSAIQAPRSTAGGDEPINLKKMLEDLKNNIVPVSEI